MEKELDLREVLATGEQIQEIIARAIIDREFLKEVISLLDDDLWTVQKNALRVISAIMEEIPSLQEALVTKLMVMVRKSEAVPLTQEIARTFGLLARINPPEEVRKVVPIIFANYRLGDPKIKINMTYVLEEIMRANPSLLSGVFKDIGILLTSKNNADKLAALNFIAALGGDNGLKYVTPFLPKLFALLNDKDEVVRASAVETLEKLAEKNKKLRVIVIEKLKEMKDPSDLVKRKIEEALSRLLLLEKE
ncbi:PH0542 domain-containing protein [Thermococcus sp. JCM 11816]|uniref:PH0542 domain-containing protein n=1 Tax=Thermococcus sp. (strain JCM 11816 / KS-1) TaxID=1295125 RepID=UPI0006D03082